MLIFFEEYAAGYQQIRLKRWVYEDNIQLLAASGLRIFFQPGLAGTTMGRAFIAAKKLEVVINLLNCLPGFIDKDHLFRTSGESFKA